MTEAGSVENTGVMGSTISDLSFQCVLGVPTDCHSTTTMLTGLSKYFDTPMSLLRTVISCKQNLFPVDICPVKLSSALQNLSF